VVKVYIASFRTLDYPNHIFTALIWGEDRDKFSPPPENAYSGKKICVTGTISSYRGQPQIVVKNPFQKSALNLSPLDCALLGVVYKRQPCLRR
jgi:hypothetical protein